MRYIEEIVVVIAVIAILLLGADALWDAYWTAKAVMP
jgi:hypothetical protein